MPAKDRITLTIQLTPGKDDDLIRWAGKLNIGGRNQKLKDLLRAALDLPMPPVTDPVQDVRAALDTALSTINAQARRLAEQDQQLELVKHTVANIPTIINTMTGKKGGTASPNNKSELEELRRQVEWLTEAVNWLNTNGVTSGAPAPMADDSAMARLTDDELNARAARLDQADW